MLFKKFFILIFSFFYGFYVFGGVFSREYSKATVQMDCNAFGAKFTARR